MQVVLAFGNPDPAFCKMCKLVRRALLPRLVNHIFKNFTLFQFKANKILLGEYKAIHLRIGSIACTLVYMG